MHALVDTLELPILLNVTEGQAHDGRSAGNILRMLDDGDVLLTDRARKSRAMCTNLAERGAWSWVKPMPNRKIV